MRKVLIVLLFIIPFFGFAQNTEYSVRSYKTEGTKAPNTHYIGEAWLNALLQADESLNFNITKATFKANSTLDWHKHSTSQVLIIVEGQGYYQEKGKKPMLMREGDVLKCSANVEHWHASSKEMDVTYLAIYTGETIWTEVLSQEAYDIVAKALKEN